MNTPLWFAPSGIEYEPNVYFQAHTTFESSTVPVSLKIDIAAESWYRLWCNGYEVASGPARGTASLNFFDTLDLTPFLISGINRLEVLVGTTNQPTFKVAPIRPALWAQIEGLSLTWQTARDESFDSQSSLYNFQTGYCEWQDLRVEIQNWQAPEFFELPKKLLPRDCLPLEVSKHFPSGAIFPQTLEADGFAVYDFGREIIGGAELEIEAESGTLIEVAHSEHLTDGRVNIHVPSPKHTYADRYTTREGKQLLPPTLQERGFRYLQVTASKPITIDAVTSIDRRYPLPAPTFYCEDERFNRLYRMAHHTVSSCATDTINDCPWREQALWMNDLVVNALFWLEAGGDPQLVARCINLALSERNEEGLIYSVVPNGNRPDLIFLATNAFLPLILLEVAKRDTALAHSFLPAMNEVMQGVAKYAAEDGLLIGPEKYWNFLDWSFEIKGHSFLGGSKSASINGFYILALDAMAHLHRQAGSESAHWQELADRVASNWHQLFWSEEHLCYWEREDNEMRSELALALACIANRDPTLTASLSQKLADDRDNLFKPEPYMMHYVLRALVENGHHEAAKARLLTYWGAMLEANSPTLWEANVHQHGPAAFTGAGSLCHAFSCAPLWALPRIYDKEAHAETQSSQRFFYR